MNHKYCYIICFMLLGLCTSCTTTYTSKIVKPYTTLAKIQKVSLGMSVPELNQALDSEPAELYHKTAEGSLMIGYEYFTKDRVFSLSSSEISTAQNDEASQTKADAGDYANAKYVNKLIAIFKDGKLTSILTADEGQYLMKTEVGIKSISKGELNKLIYQNESASEVEEASKESNVQELKPKRVRREPSRAKFTFGVAFSKGASEIESIRAKVSSSGFSGFWGVDVMSRRIPALTYSFGVKSTALNSFDMLDVGATFGVKYYPFGNRQKLYTKVMLGLQVIDFFYRKININETLISGLSVVPSFTLGTGYMLNKNMGISLMWEVFFPKNISFNYNFSGGYPSFKLKHNNLHLGINFIFGR